VTIQRSITGANRIVALALGLIWLSAGAAALAAGLLYGRWLLAGVAVFALGYAILWFRVVARSRLLTWSDLAAPWRVRKMRP
jgi:hypothetical protein